MWVQAPGQLVGKLAGSVGFPVISQVWRERPGTDGCDLPAPHHRHRRCLRVGVPDHSLRCPLLIDLLYPDYGATSVTFMSLLGLGILASRFDPRIMLALSFRHSRTMMSVSAMRVVAVCVSLPLCFALFGIAGALIATALSPLAASTLLIARIRPILGKGVAVDMIWLMAGLVVAAIVYQVYAL